MKIYKGSIVTCDDQNRVHKYLVEDKGKIIFTGDELPQEYQSLPVEDLGGKALLPAFCDSHIHFVSFSFFQPSINVRDVASNEETATRIANHLKQSKEKFYLAFGVSAHNVKEKRLLTRGDLDRQIRDIPVMVFKYDGHAAIANSAMLKILPKNIASLRGYHPEEGLLEQEAYFAGSSFVSGKVSPIELMGRILKGYDYVAKQGIGMIHAVEGIGFPLDLDIGIMRFIARGLNNPMNLRLFFQTMNVKKVLKRKLPRIGGCFETATDGAFGSLDAALHEPYQGKSGGDCGILFHDDEKLIEFAKEANRAGLQIEMHAIGDKAIDQAAHAIEAALEDFPRKDHRHTIIHGFMPTEKALEKMARHDIYIAQQPALIDDPLEPASYHQEILGNRSKKLNPLRTCADMGITMTGGSDGPVTMPDPIRGIYLAANHPISSESLSIAEALKMFTINAARGSFDEKTRGSLEAGKMADMTILNQNPLDMKAKDLMQLKVEELLLAGKPYQEGQGLGELFINQIFPKKRLAG